MRGVRLSHQVGGFLYSLIDFGSPLVTPVHGDPQSWSMSHELVSNPSSARGTASSSNGQKTSPLESSRFPIRVLLLEYQKVVR